MRAFSSDPGQTEVDLDGDAVGSRLRGGAGVGSLGFSCCFPSVQCGSRVPGLAGRIWDSSSCSALAVSLWWQEWMHAAVRSWRFPVNKPVPSYSPVPASGPGRLLSFILVGALVVGDSVGDGGDCSLVNKLVFCAHLKMEGLRAVELHLAGRGGEGVRLSGVWRGAATIPLAGRGGEGGKRGATTLSVSLRWVCWMHCYALESVIFCCRGGRGSCLLMGFGVEADTCGVPKRRRCVAAVILGRRGHSLLSSSKRPESPKGRSSSTSARDPWPAAPQVACSPAAALVPEPGGLSDAVEKTMDWMAFVILFPRSFL